MRVRKEDAAGDYRFGHGAADFHINTPDAVGVLCVDRLHLWYGDWFLDTSDGTPYRERVLGRNTEATRDIVLRSRMVATPGVTEIGEYGAVLNRETRGFSVLAKLNTDFGETTLRTAYSGGA